MGRGLGSSPQIPKKWAATQLHPPPPPPPPPAEHPDAIPAASPPLEPPAEYSVFHGLLVFPLSRLFVSYAIRNSGVFVLPSKTAPAWRRRWMRAASILGLLFFRNKEPAAQGQPATSIQLFIVSGMPCSGPS